MFGRALHRQPRVGSSPAARTSTESGRAAALIHIGTYDRFLVSDTILHNSHISNGNNDRFLLPPQIDLAHLMGIYVGDRVQVGAARPPPSERYERDPGPRDRFLSKMHDVLVPPDTPVRRGAPARKSQKCASKGT